MSESSDSSSEEPTPGEYAFNYYTSRGYKFVRKCDVLDSDYYFLATRGRKKFDSRLSEYYDRYDEISDLAGFMRCIAELEVGERQKMLKKAT